MNFQRSPDIVVDAADVATTTTTTSTTTSTTTTTTTSTTVTNTTTTVLLLLLLLRLLLLLLLQLPLLMLPTIVFTTTTITDTTTSTATATTTTTMFAAHVIPERFFICVVHEFLEESLILLLQNLVFLCTTENPKYVFFYQYLTSNSFFGGKSLQKCVLNVFLFHNMIQFK